MEYWTLDIGIWMSDIGTWILDKVPAGTTDI